MFSNHYISLLSVKQPFCVMFIFGNTYHCFKYLDTLPRYSWRNIWIILNVNPLNVNPCVEGKHTSFRTVDAEVQLTPRGHCEPGISASSSEHAARRVPRSCSSGVLQAGLAGDHQPERSAYEGCSHLPFL